MLDTAAKLRVVERMWRCWGGAGERVVYSSLLGLSDCGGPRDLTSLLYTQEICGTTLYKKTHFKNTSFK